MAEQVTLNVNVETGEAVKNLGDLEKATKGVAKSTEQAAKSADSLEDRFDQLNKEISEGPVNIRRMNKQIQEYQAIALEAGRTSPLGKQAIAEAAQLKDRYNDITAEVNRLANDGVKLQAALDLGTSITAGYTAFQGALALSGVESEKLQETLVKLQAAQSLLVGVETIRRNLEKESTLVLVAKSTAEKVATATTAAYTFVTSGATAATKLLRLALLSLPFVAIGAAITALIAYWDDLVGGIKSGLKWLGLYDDSEEKAAAAAKKRLKEERELRKLRLKQIESDAKREQAIHDQRIHELDNEIKIAKSLGKSTVDLEREKLQAVIEFHKGQRPLIEESIALKRKDIELEIARLESYGKFFSKVKKSDEKLIELKQQLLDLDNQQDAATQAIQDAEINLAVFENELLKDKREKRKKASEEKKKEDDKEIEEAKKKALELEKIERQRIQNIQKLEDDLFATIEQLDEQARQRKQTDQQNEIDAVNEKYFALINSTMLGEEEILRLKTQLKEEEAIINEKFRQQEMEQDAAVQNSKVDLALNGLTAIMDLTNAFAKDNEKSQRRAFEINKRLQIAQAIISTYQGANNIFASAAANPKSVLFPAQPFIAAGLAIVSGLANVATIAKQQFQGGSAGGGGVTSPNFNTGGGGAAPQIEPVTNTSTLIGQEPQQVFVTETDITNTQNQVAVIETQATIK
jgi:hypothetical protein